MSILRNGDELIHYRDGTHRLTAPQAINHDLWAARVTEHLEEHQPTRHARRPVRAGAALALVLAAVAAATVTIPVTWIVPAGLAVLLGPAAVWMCWILGKLGSEVGCERDEASADHPVTELRHTVTLR